MILLQNGRVFIDRKLVKKDLLIKNGKIERIFSDYIVDNKQVKIIDCKGLLILPGIIDPHVHMREPGLTQKEDFYTGSCAAAAGGITSFQDMPNTKPPILTVKELDNKRKLAKKSIVNYGFFMGSSPDNISEIKKAKNISGTKVYMDISTGKMKIEKNLSSIFNASTFIAVHAEGDKIKEAVKLAKNKPLYICHVSSAEETKWLKKNKKKNHYIEVSPNHLYLTAKKDPFLEVKPCLKSKKDNKALWNAIKSGLVDTIGTDHAPHTISEKKKGNCYGIPGEETLLPLMLDAVNKKKLSLKKLVELCCHNPAKIFGIRNKGLIKEGYDADLVLIDMNLSKKVDARKLYTKCKWSPYNNKLLKGWPIMTIVNGKIVFDKGKIIQNQGSEIEYERRNS